MSRKRWRAESCLYCLHCVQHIIVCHFSGGSAAGSSGRRGLAGAGPNFVVMGAAPGTLAVDTVTLGPSC